MKNSSDPVKQPKLGHTQRLRFLLLNRTSITLGVLTLLVGFAGGVWWLRVFVYEQLAPLVEKNLTQTLNRPVQLGRVERFSLTGLQFGKSSVPATKNDPDQVLVDAVDVAFDPLRLLFTRTLKLDVTLVNPDIYIQQDVLGRWTSTTLKAEEKAGPIKTDLDKIRFRNADVVLVPNAEASKRGASTPASKKRLLLAGTQVNGFAQFLENNQLIQFELGGEMARGGTLALQGEYRPSTEHYNFEIRTQNLLASDVTRLIPLPLDLQAGRVDGNLKVQLRKQQTELFGTAVLKAVRVQINQLPQPFINSQGTLRFKGTLIGLDNVSTSYGKIGAIANGVIDTETGYNLAARVPAVSVANAQQTLNIQLPVAASGVVKADIGLTGSILKPILLGTVATIKPARIDKVDFSNIQAQFAFSAADSVTAFKDIVATPTLGGKVTGAGIIQLGQKGGLGFDLVAQNIPGDAIARLYNVSPQIKIGTVSATTAISGTPTKPETIVNWQAAQATYPGTGQIRIIDQNTIIFRNTVLSVAGGTVRGAGQLVDSRWQASVQVDNVQLGRLAQVPPALQSPLSGTFNLSGTTASFQPEAIRATGTGQIQVAGGTVAASNIQLAAGRWQAQLRATGVQLGRLAQVPPALQAPLSGTFNLSGTTASFQPEAIQATSTGQIQVASGITASNIQLAGGRWQAQLRATGVQLGRLAQGIAPQFRGLLTGTFNLAGTTASFQPETISGSGQGRLNIAGGTVRATNIQLAKGQWQAVVNASQVQLKQFSEQLRGQFSGQLKLAGTVDAKLADIRAAGQVRFSQGVGLIQQPLTALVGWDGKKIIVQQATAPNLKASGLIFAKVEGVGAPLITGLNLNVQAQNYNLQDLPFELPNAVALAGKGDFAGRLFGTLPTPNVVGSLRLRGLVVNNLAFEPILTGDVQVVPGRGVELEVTGEQDRIAFNLDPNYRPTSFLIQRDQAVASGQSQGENLLVNVENFPLAALNLTPPNSVAPGPVAGLLTGDFQINQAQSTVVGDVAIAQPAIGRLKGDAFVGQFRYANGVTTLTSGEFTLADSRYALAGSFSQTSKGPQFQGQVNITQGQIQDVLTALQFFELQDFSRGLQPPTYATASELRTVPVGLPQALLLTQLRRFSEIEALLQQQRQQRQDTFSLPPLADLKGTFNGEIFVDGSFQDGVAVDFDLDGKNWEFGDYNTDQVIAEGSFKNGVLTLLPLRIESEDTLLAFNGQVGGTQQSGQLQVRNFPVDVLDNFVRLPNDVELTGNLNATATLAGSVDNPQAVGELQLTDGTLNQKAVESALGSFSYANARLNFGSNVVVSGPEPITITGSVPFQLPFAAVKPDNQIRLDVDVQNDGLALLNLFTDSFAWKDGQGQVQLQVRGTTQQPLATGIVTVNNATITAAALPEPLTDVAGTVRFDFDRILVESLQGKFSNGQVVAQGVIPIFKNLQPNDPDLTNPLTVSLDQLALNLQGLYRGGASGNVVVTGTALSPVLGGEVRLAEGEVLLADENATTPTSSSGTSGAIEALRRGGEEGAGGSADGSIPKFNNLRLTLGDDVAIIRQPILNFQATGTLILNGTRNDIRPAGTISLRRGSINLFTTQFVLARGYEQTATFSPNQALDPTLDIRLIAAVPEVTQRRVPSSSVSSEITETFSTNVGGLETIRVQARVTGPASQLFDNLELTSDPSRSQSEIIALIGGGFVDTLGRGDSALGLANFASSALLGNFQGTITNIGNAIGLSELRIFPTITTEERSRNSTLALAAEAGIDISRDIYFSILKVLTDEEPTRFGLVYRLNDRVRVRTSTDLSGDSSAVVEYENRF